MSENGQFWTKRYFCDFSSVLTFFAYFQALILVANLNQNTTCYSVLEMVECEQQYFGRFVAIYSTCQKLFGKNQTENWYKNWSFSEHYFDQLELLDWKTICTIKNYEPF